MLNLSQNRLATVQALETLPALVALNLGESFALSYVMHRPIKGRLGNASLNLHLSQRCARDRSLVPLAFAFSRHCSAYSAADYPPYR